MARLNDPNDRQRQINEIRARNQNAFDNFDENFDRHFDRVDNMLAHPGRTMAKVAAIYVVMALVIIAAVFFGIWLVFG